MIDAIVQLYEAGGLTLLVVVGLGSACVLLYRDLRATRERLLDAEVSHVKQLVRVWQKLSETRRTFGDRESIVETPPTIPPRSNNVKQLAVERDRAWNLIEHNLNAIATKGHDQ
jgi:hypothetical protein